jgi:Protein of unknown function (DUF2817)
MLAEIEPWFASDYPSARANFQQAARAAGREVETIEHPLRGPAGETLACDVVLLGPADASKVLFLTSGMHGPELYCGSGVQCALLALCLVDPLPPDMAVVLVHAINPWGSAHVRRMTENNVDPCRNFIDFDRPLPANTAYERLHPHLGFDSRPGPQGDEARSALAAVRAELGSSAYQTALMSGQYIHPDGFSFGGTAPEWTNRTMTALLQRHAGDAAKVAAIDLHSGVGPWGYGLAVVVHEGEALARARRWYGNWLLAPNDPDSGSGDGYRVTGHSCEGYARALPGSEVTAMVLEFGTYAPDRFAKAMTDDHWLTFHGKGASPADHAAIKSELAGLFNPDDAEWRAAVWDRSRQAIRQAIAGLTETSERRTP